MVSMILLHGASVRMRMMIMTVPMMVLTMMMTMSFPAPMMMVIPVMTAHPDPMIWPMMEWMRMLMGAVTD